mmetsp:Transcript_22736/g.56515  ORF Transcript_22736/g.56515 Transcript_22736/m.56515 type:complete len:266 (-) Transcript_22736:337-1134(-)
MVCGSSLLAAAAGVGCGLLIARWWQSGALNRARYRMRDLCLLRAKESLAEGPAISARHSRRFPIGRSDTALVLIDMQTDFLSVEGRVGKHYDPARIQRMEKTIDKVEELLTACRAAGLTIAHSRSHRYGARVLPELIHPLDETYELHPRLRAKPGEIVVDKFTFGAFASTELEERLRERGVTRILLGGVLTNVCVFATAVQAVDRFFRVCLVEDACGAFTDEWHERAVSLIEEPQVDPQAHHHSVGLYFGEVAAVSDVKAALTQL